jgi:hypothetical protein
MTMPAQEARAYVKDKNGNTVYYYTIKDLKTVFEDEK